MHALFINGVYRDKGVPINRLWVKLAREVGASRSEQIISSH